MALVNISKPTTSLTNTTKVSSYETWDTNTTTWDTETRTWDDMGSLFDNVSKGTTGFLWSLTRFPWTETAPWLTDNGITNISKPA
jgi:hypothetical protein